MASELQLYTTKTYNGIEFDCYVEAGRQNVGDFWATREQIGRLLEYENPNDAIRFIHNRNKERLDRFATPFKLTRVEGDRTVTREVILYSFKGLLEICRYSNQPKADAIIDWLWEIADQIRRQTLKLQAVPKHLARCIESTEGALQGMDQRILACADRLLQSLRTNTQPVPDMESLETKLLRREWATWFRDEDMGLEPDDLAWILFDKLHEVHCVIEQVMKDIAVVQHTLSPVGKAEQIERRS